LIDAVDVGYLNLPAAAIAGTTRSQTV